MNNGFENNQTMNTAANQNMYSQGAAAPAQGYQNTQYQNPQGYQPQQGYQYQQGYQQPVRTGGNTKVQGLIFLAIGIICLIFSAIKMSQFGNLENQARHVVGSGSLDTGSAVLSIIAFILGIVFTIIGIVKLVKKPRY